MSILRGVSELVAKQCLCDRLLLEVGWEWPSLNDRLTFTSAGSVDFMIYFYSIHSIYSIYDARPYEHQKEDIYIYKMYFLTAIGLPPVGSSTVHIYTQTICRKTQNFFWKSAGRAPSLRVLPWHLPYNSGKSTEKNSVRVAEECQLAWWRYILRNLLCYVCVAVFNLDAGLLARSQYSEGPATGQLDTGFCWFPCVYNQMLRRFPRFQVATTCFSCSPPDLNLLITNFMFCLHVK